METICGAPTHRPRLSQALLPGNFIKLRIVFAQWMEIVFEDSHNFVLRKGDIVSDNPG